jgi:hypothetical protein
MADHREIRVPTNDGKLVTIRVREKGRQIEDGVEGTVFALLNPNTLREVGEFWAPIADQPEAEVAPVKPSTGAGEKV